MSDLATSVGTPSTSTAGTPSTHTVGTPNTPTTPTTPNISIGSVTDSYTSSRRAISVVGAKFIPNGHSISKTITETFKERQDVRGYTWKSVCQSTRDFYWHEFMKLYLWNPVDQAIMKHTWNKVASVLYTKKMYLWRKSTTRPLFISEENWDSWNVYWFSDEYVEKSKVATQNRCSETAGGTGPSKHTGGSRSTVEHTIKLTEDLKRPANSWDVFKKLHKKKDGNFVDTKSKSVNDKMEVAMAAATPNSLDDTEEVQEVDVNRIYLDVVGGEKKRCVYGLGSQALTMYQNCSSVTASRNLHVTAAEDRIKFLEDEVTRVKENQDRILEQRVGAEVQQRVQLEVSRLRQESDERIQSSEERCLLKMREMVAASHHQHPRPSGDPTIFRN